MRKLLTIMPWTAAIFIIAALIRVLWLGDIPGGLNQDEASSGYDAWALLHSGIDRHGVSWPVHFIAWGSGQNALYAYLSMPFIAIMGLSITSIRLASACLGILALWLFWRMGKRSDAEMGLWALIVIATSPWHIMASRWALESNAAPAVILLATYCFMRARDNISWLPIGSAILAISVYAYGTAYFFAPLFMLCAWLILNSQERLPLKTLAISAFVAFILTLPLMAFIINNSMGSGHLHWGPISIPKYPSEARYSGIFLPLAPGGMAQVPDNIIQVLRMLLAAHDDGLPWNASPTWGPQFWILTPFLMMGTAYAIAKGAVIDRLMLAWFACALLTAFFTAANINRINLIWLPSLWLAARGLWLLQPKPLLNRLAQIMLCSLGVFFTVYYFISWQEKITASFFPGLGDAIKVIQEQAPVDAPIIVTDKSIYTSVIFFMQPDPTEYVATAIIPDPTSPFQSVLGFGHVRFGIRQHQIANNNYWVAHISELANFNLAEYNIQTFGNYAAVTRRPQSEIACYQPLPLSELSGSQDYSVVAINRDVDSPVEGLPILEQIFKTGFGVHGDSNWSTYLNSPAESLQIGLGLSATSGCSDGMEFRILLDEKLAYESQVLKPGQLKFTEIGLQNAKKITFITRAGGNNRCDHGLWITPTVKRCPH